MLVTPKLSRSDSVSLLQTEEHVDFPRFTFLVIYSKSFNHEKKVQSTTV